MLRRFVCVGSARVTTSSLLWNDRNAAQQSVAEHRFTTLRSAKQQDTNDRARDLLPLTVVHFAFGQLIPSRAISVCRQIQIRELLEAIRCVFHCEHGPKGQPSVFGEFVESLACSLKVVDYVAIQQRAMQIWFPRGQHRQNIANAVHRQHFAFVVVLFLAVLIAICIASAAACIASCVVGVVHGAALVLLIEDIGGLQRRDHGARDGFVVVVVDGIVGEQIEQLLQ
mmetsp:Transcript_19319/g.30630  ORF Transcript_19319/g.30630 Transcript_19319/m.30630 type:complete len:226 (+) Transcript_19319:933-1610(+)